MSGQPSSKFENYSLGDLINLLIITKNTCFYNDKAISSLLDITDNDTLVELLRNESVTLNRSAFANSLRVGFHFRNSKTKVRAWYPENYNLEVIDDLILYYEEEKLSMPTTERVREMKYKIIHEINKYERPIIK